MSDKKWNILFRVNELPAAHAEQFVSIDAANLGLAINRGWTEIKKRQNVKGKRVKSGRITFHVEDTGDES